METITETTTSKFKRLAMDRFIQINPEVDTLIEFDWQFVSDGFVPDRVGNGATMHGNFIATAAGHAPRRVMVSMEQGASDVSLR